MPDDDGRREPRARPGARVARCGCRAGSTPGRASCSPRSASSDSTRARPVERLSVAEMQLLEIARLLVRDARILIFDEPTAALADREIERVLAVIRRLAAEGRSVIYVTHRLPEVFRIADRVTVFRNGRSLPPGRDRELDVDAVITMMLGRELETMFPDRASALGDEPAARGRRPARARPRRAGELRSARRRDRRPDRPARQRRRARRPGARGHAAAARPGRVIARRRGDSAAQPRRDAAARRRLLLGRPQARRDLRRAADPREPLLAVAALGRRRGGWISARRERERAREIAGRFAIDVEAARLAGRHAQRRQPAEGRGRQVARVRAPRAAARGADARGRHRRACRDLPAAARPLRRRASAIVVASLRHRRGAVACATRSRPSTVAG